MWSTCRPTVSTRQSQLPSAWYGESVTAHSQSSSPASRAGSRAHDALVGPELVDALRRTVRDVPDFPTPGIVFKDVTPLLADATLFRRATEALAAPFTAEGVTHVVAVEARGFIFGAPAAQHLHAGLIPVRKAGKLPWQTERMEYALEYGTGVLEIHRDACGQGMRVVVVDDVLATGGTAAATCALIERLGAQVVGCSFLIELAFLRGRSALAGRRAEVVLRYE
jgi:adenine phosphoribosyltransferase